jgi:hypothetical protein
MSSEETQRSVYELIHLMSALNDTKRAILMALGHIYPRSVSGVQLSRLIGYSGRSRSLYRGVLAHLEENKMILIDQLTPKLYAIRINAEHPLLSLLVDLCKEYGDETRRIYMMALEEEQWTDS